MIKKKMTLMYCAELMKELKLQLRIGSVNILNGFAGCGKTEFLLKYLLEQPELYIENIPERLRYLQLKKNRILYVTDTKNLKKQMINKYNCKELKKDVLNEYVKNDIGMDNIEEYEGKLVTCTYSTLGYYLQKPEYEEWFIKNFYVVIFDEAHNLINYESEHGEKDDSYYSNITYNLDKFAKHTLFITATATPNKVYKYIDEWFKDLEQNTIFNDDSLKGLMHYENEKLQYYIDIEKAYDLVPSYIEQGKKVFIYTQKIKTMKRIAGKLEAKGLKVLIIWSDNSKDKYPMTKEQEDGIEHILLNEKVEDKYDVVIINDATTTGVNIKSKEYQVCIIDSYDEDTRVQARNRLRHDIELLIYKHHACKDGGITLKDTVDFVNDKPKEIDSKYLGVELKGKLKSEVIDKYCPSYCTEKSDNWYVQKSWSRLVEWLENNGYEVNKNIINVKGEGKDMLTKYLEDCMKNKTVWLQKDDRTPLIEQIGLRNSKGFVKSIGTLNSYLNEDLGLPYQIKQFETSKIIDGSKKNFKSAWKIIKYID